MKTLLTRIWSTVRVYFGYEEDPAYIGQPIQSLWEPR